ncbi:hypothetical protein MASR1M42_22150 [Azonexus hydrophilus]
MIVSFPAGQILPFGGLQGLGGGLGLFWFGTGRANRLRSRHWQDGGTTAQYQPNQSNQKRGEC